MANALVRKAVTNIQLTEKQENFLTVLFEEADGNTKKAFDLAGYAKDRAMRSRVARQLADEIVERAKLFLASNAAKAAISLTGVLDTPEKLHNRATLTAAREILDRVGIVKKEQIEVSGNIGGLFILPPKEVVTIEAEYAELETTKEAK